jgi:hypothetical protein
LVDDALDEDNVRVDVVGDRGNEFGDEVVDLRGGGAVARSTP